MRLSRMIPSPLRPRPRTVHSEQEAGTLMADGFPRESPRPLHVIATRHGIGVFDECWFEYRQLLLEHLTLASIDAQTSKDFLWLIGIDRDMPQEARKRLDGMVEGRPHIRLLEVELKRDFKGAVANWVSTQASEMGARWIMTTRLDDDDAIHRELVERLHREAGVFLDRGERRTAVFAPALGCNWVPAEMSGHRSFHPSPSMGLTVMLPSSERRSIYDWNHMKLAEQLAPSGAYIKSIDDDTMWWLYAHTRLSDQHREGSNRRTKAHAHTHAFELDEATLGEFGISPESARLVKRTPEPQPVDTTHYLTKRGADVEREIHELRRALRRRQYANDAEAMGMRDRIAELHSERRRMHQGLVHSAGPPGSSAPNDSG